MPQIVLLKWTFKGWAEGNSSDALAGVFLVFLFYGHVCYVGAKGGCHPQDYGLPQTEHVPGGRQRKCKVWRNVFRHVLELFDCLKSGKMLETGDICRHLQTSKATVGKIMELWRPVCLAQTFSCNEGNWWDLHYASHGQTMALMQTGAWWCLVMLDVPEFTQMDNETVLNWSLARFITPDKFIGFDWHVAAYGNVWPCMAMYGNMLSLAPLQALPPQCVLKSALVSAWNAGCSNSWANTPMLLEPFCKHHRKKGSILITTRGPRNQCRPGRSMAPWRKAMKTCARILSQAFAKWAYNAAAWC